MLPWAARDASVRSRASSGRPRASATASRTFGPPGWQTQASDVVGGQAVLGEEGPAGRRPGGAGPRRGHRVEHDAEPASPTSQPIRCSVSGIEVAAGGHHRRARPPPGARRPRPAATAPASATSAPRRRRTARWRPGWRWRRHRLQGQGAQLDREQHRHVVRPAAQVVVHPGEAGGARHAAQAEDRHPLDVGPQPEARGQPGVERRRGDSGHRGEHDHVHVGGSSPASSSAPVTASLAQVQAPPPARRRWPAEAVRERRTARAAGPGVGCSRLWTRAGGAAGRGPPPAADTGRRWPP